MAREQSTSETSGGWRFDSFSDNNFGELAELVYCGGLENR